ncbi:phospholipase A-2-activating protein-like [Lytechinus variegatus]|uniref:phospholipase A-2-activating protein-like n=1 Tax=Lytechinus variegatus TaxID=7654 RepID=UPI001BB19CAD|nr:phospholipase A-2-activating protein-like [Lytechinus variegatus]XP_041475059.1 phospholipase A-2-activating protein-like [Lytechinus variegatus]
MALPFKLSCTLAGHESDVRAVAAGLFPEGSIITASRDRTTRLWVPSLSDSEPGYDEAHCMSGHQNFVSCVCVLPPSEKYAQGLIVTGSNDNKIHAYTLESPLPVYVLTGHKNAVCALAAGKFGTLLSGSWDMTAKVWLNEKNVMTLQGHEATVWAVALLPTQGLMLTGSADKTIKMWRAGRCERTFTGHTDCVRALAILSEVEFLSASNDGSVRRWLTTGDCVHQYDGHVGFIYSISLLNNGQDFVTSSEDRTMRVWTDGQCSQTITMPAQSIWSVASLPNGDILVGSSDGMARVFTREESRFAPAEAQQAFEKQVGAFAMPAKTQTFGGIKMEDLPDKSDLNKPGTKEGQTKLIRTGKTVEAYQWSSAESKWSKIGDVVGTEGDDVTPSSGRVHYEGKEYDYVFDVDLEEGRPNLKLPYNTSDDPWLAAQKFIHDNDLSQYYLEQVANFIIQNTKGVTLGSAPRPDFVDPFTGGSRYVPGSQGDPALPSVGGGGGAGGHDPFTGASSYKPGGSGAAAKPQPAATMSTNQYFPKKDYVTFDSANTQAILGKITQLNSTVDASCRLDDTALSHLESLAACVSNGQGSTPTGQQLASMWSLLQWPQDQVFPGLDLLRLAIRNPAVNQHFCNPKDGPGFLSHLFSLAVNSSPPANHMLLYRTLCNCFSQSEGKSLLVAQRETIGASAMGSLTIANKNLRIAVATLALNYAVLLHGGNDVEAKSQCVAMAITQLGQEKESEAQFRLLVCLGTLLAGDENSQAIANSLDASVLVKGLLGVTDPQKVGDCARLVKQLLQ